jgi:hypothetical protein
MKAWASIRTEGEMLRWIVSLLLDVGVRIDPDG